MRSFKSLVLVSMLISGGMAQATDLLPSIGSIPAHLNKFKNIFNPARGPLEISYDQGNVSSLQILDRDGNVIRTLDTGLASVGTTQKTTWDGRNEQGDLMPSGIYMLQMKVGDQTQTRKIVLIK